jgi:hypothetical protein
MRDDALTDAVARSAARLYVTGEVDDLDAAVRRAALGFAALPERWPSLSLVRQHVRGRAEEALGREGYRAAVAEVLRIAEELMAFIEIELEAGPTRLAGRAAAGNVDGGATLFVRIYTDWPMATLVDRLVERGYEEPTFITVDTTVGRLDRIRFEEEGQVVVLTRCPATMLAHAEEDLVTGRRLPCVDLKALRARIEDPA